MDRDPRDRGDVRARDQRGLPMRRVLLAAIELVEAVIVATLVGVAGVASVTVFVIIVPFTLFADWYFGTSKRCR